MALTLRTWIRYDVRKCSQDQDQWKFNHRVEDHWGNQCVENPAKDSADRNPEIKFGETLCGWTAACEFAMTNHGHAQEGEQVQRDPYQDRQPRSRGNWKSRSENQKREAPNQPVVRNKRFARKDENKAEQIKRQRHNPEQRNRRHVGGESRSDTQCETGGNEGQNDPAKSPLYAGTSAFTGFIRRCLLIPQLICRLSDPFDESRRF